MPCPGSGTDSPSSCRTDERPPLELSHLGATGDHFTKQPSAARLVCGHLHPFTDNWRLVMEALLLKPEEVAEYLNIGRSKVYELMSAGQLESVRIGSSRRIPRAAAEAFVESLRHPLVAS